MATPQLAAQRRSPALLPFVIPPARAARSLLAPAVAADAALHAAPVDLNTVVRNIVRCANAAATGRSVTWQLGPLPTVWGDRALLHQVFDHLIGNALRHTRTQSEAHITIRRDPATLPHETVVAIADNGVGFDPRHVDELFEVPRGRQRSGPRARLALGLAGVKRIVERHGGRVWATSAPGAGATFFVALPHAPDPCAARSGLPPALGVPA